MWTFAGTLNLALDPTCVEGLDEIPLATGGISGTPAVAGNIPSNWTVFIRGNSLVLKKIKGTLLIFR